MYLYSLFSLIPNAIFTGTLIMVPCLLIIHLFKIRIFNIDKQVLVGSVNWVLLFASVLYMLVLFIEVFKAYFLAGEYEQFAFSNRLTGPFWLYTMSGIVNYILMPQLLWFKKFRNSIVTLSVIWSVWVILWVVSTIITFIPYGSVGIIGGFSGIDLLKRLLIYIVIVTVTYLILNRRKMTPISETENQYS